MDSKKTQTKKKNNNNNNNNNNKNPKQPEVTLFPENAYLAVIRKKIRNLRKKQKNIQEIEKKLKEKKEINEDQRNALKTKEEVEEKLNEWLKIETQMVEVAQNETQPSQQIDPNLQTLVSLLHLSTFYSDSSPSGIGNRNEFLEFQKERQNSGASVSVNHITHFDQVQNFVSHALVTESDIQKSTQKTIEEVQKVVQGVDSTIVSQQPIDLNNLSYRAVRDTLNEILEVYQLIQQRPPPQVVNQPTDESALPPEFAAFEEDYPEDQEAEQPFERQGGNDQRRGASNRGKRGGGGNRGNFRGASNRGKGSNRGNNRGNFRGGQGKKGNAQYQQKQQPPSDNAQQQ